MTLPLVITAGDPGHIADHEEIHELLQRIDGQSAFLATGVQQDVLASRPAAGVSNRGLIYHATDVPATYYSDGSTWRQWVLTSTTNQFTAINEYADDVFFGSGKPWADVMHSDYGATADGIANDTAAIQAAVDAIEAIGGGIVWIPPTDDFYLVDEILIDADGITVMGAGYASHLKTSAIDTRVFSVGNSYTTNVRRTGITITRLRFTQIQGHSDDDHGAIRMFAITDGRVLDCDFTDCEIGVSITHGDTGLTDRRSIDCIVAGNRINEARRMGIEIFHDLRARVENNIIVATGSNGTQHGIRVDASEDCVITENTIIGHQTGVSIQGTSAGYLPVNPFCLRINVTRNKINAKVDGIQAYNDVRDSVIEDNEFYSLGTGSAFQSCAIRLKSDTEGSWTRIVVRGNKIDATSSTSSDQPIYCEGGTNAVPSLSCTENVIYNVPADQTAIWLEDVEGVSLVKNNFICQASGVGGTATGRIIHNNSPAGSVTISIGNTIVAASPSAANKNATAGAVGGTFITFDVNGIDTNVYIQTDGTRRSDGYREETEITTPAAPAANKVRLFTRDTGGVTEWVARFNGNIRPVMRDSARQTYVPTNYAVTRSIDASAISAADLADVVATLIADLQDTGTLGL